MMLFSAYVDVVADADGFDWEEFWGRFRSHKHKLKTITQIEDWLLAQPHPENYMDALREQVSDLEAGKQRSLYSDFTEGQFHVPKALFSAKMAGDALKWAQGRVRLVCEFEHAIRKTFHVQRNDGMRQVVRTTQAKDTVT